jgi:sugar fermentation stimulation protein A
MQTIKLYPGFEEASFVERDNRFVMTLEKNSRRITAYVANPGRMEEFLTPGHPFYITSGNKGKYFYRVVSTAYQDSYVLLDTIKINYLVERMLKNNLIDIFADEKTIRREKTVGRSKFDFLVERENKKPALLEVKSCSLCHKKTAMFPDAPTQRGRRHLEDLNRLADEGYDSYTLYLTTHRHAAVFIPNGHTDPDYCAAFINSGNIRFLAYSAAMTDPVTLDLSTLKPIPIDFEKTRILCKDRGAYLLVLYNNAPFTKTIGSLGERQFKKGYYVYVGSAMRGLENRVKRHMRKRKKRRWHLDYILPYRMKAVKVYRIRREDRIEEQAAKRMMDICRHHVPGFGASDSSMDSHFFYFSDPPHRSRNFLDLLLDFRALI